MARFVFSGTVSQREDLSLQSPVHSFLSPQGFLTLTRLTRCLAPASRSRLTL